MDNRKRKAINQIAKNLLEVLDLRPPIQIENVPELLGGSLKRERIFTEDGTEIEAMISKEGDSFQIKISPDVPENRQRFSIAHELGHLFIHMGYLIDQNKWNSTGDYRDSVYYRLGHNSEENEAHEFAGALLMPEEEFKLVAKNNLKDGRYHLEPIAKHFNVSMDAAKVRGQWLGIFQWG